jgi:ribosomal protein S18 acetylase RimI-like enzyme
MLRIRPLKSSDLESIRRFTDREIGAGYYNLDELQKIFERSVKNGTMCTLVLESDSGEIKGVRITYPPGQWEHGKGRGLQPERWPHPLHETGYFQSVFLAADLQGQGWGGKISRRALELLREVGARGVVCHSWKESPNNSSTRYLLKLGFEVVADHPFYWKDVNYNCTRCLKPPCQCTAQEMYLDLERIT